MSNYEPVAPEGKLVHSLCAETAPKDTIEFAPNGSKVTVRGHSMGLSITVPIPEQKSASFTSDEVELYHGKTEQPEKLKISEIKLYDFHNKHYITLCPLDTLIDSTRPLVMGSEARFFEIIVYFDEAATDDRSINIHHHQII